MPIDPPDAPARQSLGAALWFFIIWKSVGILISVSILAFMIVWLVPLQANLSGGVAAPQLALQGVLLALEISATAFGIVLILRRHRAMRLFWIVFLALSTLLLAGELLSGMGGEEVLFLLVTALAWLTYWIVAKRPRQLQLASYWVKS